MVFTDPSLEAGERIHFLAPYYPYWENKARRLRNARFDAFSGLILDLKKKQGPALLYFYRRIDPLLNQKIVICSVPSSDPSKLEPGIRLLGMRLALNDRTDGTACLVRTDAIPAAHQGGPRDVGLHLYSITVNDPEGIIPDSEILLLDDVTTSGASMIASRQLLLKAGASSVKCLALGETTR
jgi:phosphoribosylpyrophosphate synthetase